MHTPTIRTCRAAGRWHGGPSEGAEVHVVICTNGDKGTRDPNVDPGELAVRRAQETARAGSIVGLASQHILGYADGELVDDVVLRGELVGWIRRIAPTTVLCPDPTAVFFGEGYFNHRDHRTIGFCVLDALSPAAALPHYFPEQGPAHQVDVALLSGTLEPSVWVDVSATLEEKVAAVSCHQSQFPDDGQLARQAVRLGAAEEGRRVGVGYAESFRRLQLGA